MSTTKHISDQVQLCSKVKLEEKQHKPISQTERETTDEIPQLTVVKKQQYQHENLMFDYPPLQCHNLSYPSEVLSRVYDLFSPTNPYYSFYPVKIEEQYAYCPLKQQVFFGNTITRKPLFLETKRQVMQTDTTPQQEQAYLIALKGKPIQTKSLHKYVKIITRRFLSKRLKLGAYNEVEQKIFQQYDESNSTFITMQSLMGFKQKHQNLFVELPEHSRLRLDLLRYYSSPDMGKASMTGIMNFHQKLAMLKYLERFCDITVNPAQTNWK